MAKTNRVEVEIVATDEASPKIDRLEKKIDGLESDEARIVVTADISRLEKQLAGSRRLMEQMEGDELTVQTRVTGRIEDDLREARRLFDELDGKTGTVTITANVRQLEEQARRAASNVDDIGRSAGSSRSALANMVGNSSQDFAELTGVAGSLGVAIGQIGEYSADAAFEGEGLRSVMRNMGAVVVPVAGLAGAMFVLSQGAKQAASRTRELEEATEDLTSATDEQVLSTWNQLFLRAALDGKALDDQLKELAETNLIGARRMLDVTEAAGATTEQTRLLREAIADAERGQAQAEETQRRYGDTADSTTGEIDAQTGALARQADELDGVNARWRDYADLASVIVGNVLDAVRAIAAGDTSFTPTRRLPYSTGPGPNNIPASPSNVTIINPPGTPAVTAGQLEIFLSRNGER